jgi:hypothetical protein
MEGDFFQASGRVCHTAAHAGLDSGGLLNFQKATKTSFIAPANDTNNILRR